MVSISNKAKQIIVFVIKMLIVLGAFYFIYQKIVNEKAINWTYSWKTMQSRINILWVFVFLTLSFLNRFFEILKWQNLVLVLKKITLGEATQQVLGALTVGIFTPNGIGEYAGKALYFPKSQTKTIVFLNLICNGIQIIISIVFGILGLFILGYWYWAIIVIAALVLVFVLVLITNKITIKGYSLHVFWQKIVEIPKQIHTKNVVLALCRYLFFSHQYYLFFVFFGVDLPYSTLMGIIMATYFIASSVPNFQFFDFAVKGGIAVFFFSPYQVSGVLVVLVSMLMWLLNVVIPVVIGSFFVLKYKPKWN